MRQRTPPSVALAWWTAAMASPVPKDFPRHEVEPHAGYYRMKERRRWVPVRIWISSDIDPDTLELAGDEVLMADVNGTISGQPETIWTHLEPISREEYSRLVRDQSLSDDARISP